MVCLSSIAGAQAAQPVDASRESANTRGRGWLTAAGMSAMGLAVVGASLGTAGALIASDGQKWLSGYTQNGRVPNASEAVMIQDLVSRSKNGESLSRIGFGGAAICFALGLSAILVDGWRSTQPIALAIIPTSSGGMLSIGGSF